MIDTNILYFIIEEKDRLSRDVREIVYNYENTLYISVESVKESGLALGDARQAQSREGQDCKKSFHILINIVFPVFNISQIYNK